MLQFNELAWMREVIDGVSDFVAVISLNFVNSPKCIPIAFPKWMFVRSIGI